MTRGGAGNMLGVGGTRQHLGREALRGGGRGGRVGGSLDPQARKRELLRKLREKRQEQQRPDQEEEGERGRGVQRWRAEGPAGDPA